MSGYLHLVVGCWFSTRDRISVPVAVARARERPHSAQWVGMWGTTWSGSATWARWVPGSPGCFPGLRRLALPGGAATSGPVDSLLARCGVITRGRQRGVVGVAPNLAFDFDDALLQLADPGLELLDELTECAILGLKVDVARYAG